MRRIPLLVVSLFCLPATSLAHHPNGLDCDKFPEIPAGRCAAWKARNHSGKWWCDWDVTAGRMRAVYGHRGEPIPPGFDLAHATNEALSDNATKTLVEVYVRKLITANEDVFGFRPQGYELKLVDFERRPAGAARTVQADGSVTAAPLPAVTTITVQQVLHPGSNGSGTGNGGPIVLDDATINVQVDDEGSLLSFSSSFVTDPPNVEAHRISDQEAIDTALTAVASGYVLSSEDLVSANKVYAQVGGKIVPAIRVFISIYDESMEDAPTIEKQVLVDADTREILTEVSSIDAHDLVGHTGPNQPGAGADVFLDHPPLAGSTDPVTFATSLSRVPLHHLPLPLSVPIEGEDQTEFELSRGYFIRVHNKRQGDWKSDLGNFHIDTGFHSMLLDFDYSDSSVPLSCRNFPSSVNGPLPDGVDEENRFWESRLGEVSAYYNLDLAAEYYLERFNYQLHRSSRADPAIQVWTHTGTQEAPAWFSSRTQYDGAHPLIVVNKGWCWSILKDGNDAKWFDGRTLDFYSMGDVGRDRDVTMHEFTHAITWDIADIQWDDYSGPFKEGTADFFALSSRYEGPSPDRPVFSPWFNQVDLDPIDSATGEEIDYATPYREAEIGLDKHFVGQIWSNFLWDVRDRLLLLETELPNAAPLQHRVEDVQFEALFRMDRHVDSFREALRDLLAADAEANGKRASYELVSSAARHGIKLDRYIAAAEPNHHVMGPDINEPGLNLTFTIYTGASESFLFEIASDPSLIGGEPEVSDPRRWSFSCRPPTCVMDAIPGSLNHAGTPHDRENLQYRLRVPPRQFAKFSDDQPVFLFYRVSYGTDPARDSTIPNAGATIYDPDLPAVLFVPSGPAPACACRFEGQRSKPHWIAILLLCSAVIVLRRRAS